MLFLYVDNQYHMSPFFKELSKISTLGSNSTQFTPGATSNVKFWKDIWYDNYSLASRFQQLYNSCLNKNILFLDVINSQGHSVRFFDMLTGVCLIELTQILRIRVRLHFFF